MAGMAAPNYSVHHLKNDYPEFFDKEKEFSSNDLAAKILRISSFIDHLGVLLDQDANRCDYSQLKGITWSRFNYTHLSCQINYIKDNRLKGELLSKIGELDKLKKNCRNLLEKKLSRCK